jgi:DNA-directed RNA polymerase
MTFGYGSKQYGFQEQTVELLRSHDDAEKIEQHFGGEESLIEAASLMSLHIWNALKFRTRAAFEGMAWLQKCARAIIKSGNPVEWVVPLTGFRVRQEYFVLDKKRVETVLAGRIIQPVLYEPTKAIEEYKQANAIAPNVVHSLDAAALMLTVTQAAAEGIEAFAAVHDSYGCVPADMTLLASCTRQSFVRLYSMHNVVEELCNQFADQCEDPSAVPLPARPRKTGRVLRNRF